MEDFHCRAEASYKSPIAIAICFKSFLSFLEKYKDGLWRIQLIDHGGERTLREVYSSYFGVVSQGRIDDQLNVRRGGC